MIYIDVYFPDSNPSSIQRAVLPKVGDTLPEFQNKYRVTKVERFVIPEKWAYAYIPDYEITVEPA